MNVREYIRKEKRKRAAEWVLRELKHSITAEMQLDEIVTAFERSFQTPLEEERILYETGTFSFTGEPRFYFCLVRQFPNGEEEYCQIHVELKYAPTEALKGLSQVLWSDEFGGEFFEAIRSSEAFAYIKQQKIIDLDIYMDET